MRLALRLLLMLLVGISVTAQMPKPGVGGLFSFGTVTATGQLGSVIFVSDTDSAIRTSIGAPSNYTLAWSFTGTVPTACTLQGEGSLDNVNWYSLTGSQSCTSGNMVHIADKPVLYFRINVLTYTAGDGTTAVSVKYLRGSR